MNKSVIFHIVKIALSILISTFLLSCNGQVKPEKEVVMSGNTEFGQIVQELDHSIWVVFQDSKGDYWFGSNGKGIYHFDGNRLKLFSTKHGLIDNTIRGVQEDEKGNLFIETPNGISKFDGKSFTDLETISSPSNQWSLAPDDLWFGYNANDLYRYDGKSLYELKLPRKDLKEAFGLYERSDNSPYSIYGVDKDKEGNIWFGTVEAGAFRYDGESFIWFSEKELSTLPDGRVPGVRSMIQDRDGYFWLSNFYSKYKIDPDAPNGYEKLKAVDLPEELTKDKILYFNSGLVDKNGDLWMTLYSSGVWKYDGESLSNIEVNDGTETALIITIYQDNNGIIWLGTRNDGVYKQNGASFEKFNPN